MDLGVCSGFFCGLFVPPSFPHYRHVLWNEDMKRLFIKWFMPKPKAIAEIVAEVIAKTINESNKSELIAKYDSYAVKLTELQTFIVKLLEDGKIDDEEKAKIAAMLEPIMTKITEKI